MARNGSGTYSLPAGQPVVTGTTISSTTFNTLTSDLATALTQSIASDGQTTPTANLPMGGFKLTGLGAGTAATDSANLGQVQANVYTLVASVSGTNTVTGNVSPAIVAYATGQRFYFVPANTNTGATTLNLNSVGAKNIFWNNAACVGGELRQNIPTEVIYDGTQFHVIGSGFTPPFLDTFPVVEGSVDSTKKVRFEVDGLTTATTRVLTVLDADFTIGAATQAEQEAGSITTASVTPGRQQFHPSAAKGWVLVDNAGTVLASYNVTSVTRNGPGDYTVTWATDFSSASYSVVANVVATPSGTAASTLVAMVANALAAGTTRVYIIRMSDFTGADGNALSVVAYGDQ